MRSLCRYARLARTAIALLAGCGSAGAADRFELQGIFDVRAVHADGPVSFIYGGSGRTRFDPDHDGLRIGRLLLSGRLRLNDTWTFNAVGGAYGDPDKHPVDLTEIWFEARPYPQGPVRFKWRVGAFQLPGSLENRSVGWTTPYSISSSAINTWMGEEIRIIGSEFEARWRGQASGYSGDVAFSAGVYGWNDPAGDLISSRGWGLSDRQSTLFGGLGRPRESYYREMDGRPGYYAGLSWRHHERLELRILRYDNRADPGATNSDDIAWRTQFTSAGMRWEPDERWTGIVQTMQGQTYVGADGDARSQYAQSFRSWFALASRQWGAERLTVRYDRFSTHQHSGDYGTPPTNDDGHAVTIAYLHDFTPQWQVVGEWQQVNSAYPPRALFGEPVHISETLIQLSARYRFTLQR